MKASEFITEEHNELYEVRAAYGRGKQGTKVKFRCGSGLRSGRLVSDPNKCFKHPNIAQSQRMKKTRARTAAIQARRSKRTKKLNVASRIMRQLNRMMKQ